MSRCAKRNATYVLEAPTRVSMTCVRSGAHVCKASASSCANSSGAARRYARHQESMTSICASASGETISARVIACEETQARHRPIARGLPELTPNLATGLRGARFAHRRRGRRLHRRQPSRALFLRATRWERPRGADHSEHAREVATWERCSTGSRQATGGPPRCSFQLNAVSAGRDNTKLGRVLLSFSTLTLGESAESAPASSVPSSCPTDRYDQSFRHGSWLLKTQRCDSGSSQENVRPPN